MATASIGGTWVDGVLVVDTAARRVAFDNLDTHHLGPVKVDVREVILLRSSGGFLAYCLVQNDVCMSVRESERRDEGKILDSSLR